MHLSVGQKVTYDSKVDGFISAIARYSFTVDWLDGSTSTESLIDPDTKLKFHPLANEEPSVLKYVTCIQEKYPKEETNRNNVNPVHYDLFPEHGIQVREVLEVLCNKIDKAYPVSSFLVSDYVQAMQYFMRWFDKNGTEDIEKGVWYMNKIIKQLNDLEKKELL